MWLLLNLTTVQANTDHFNDFQKAIQQVKQEYHSHSEVGGGLSFLPSFQKGGLGRTSVFRGGSCWDRWGCLFSEVGQGGGGVKSFKQKIN